MDLLIKEIIKNNLLSKISNLEYRASLLFLINKLGYNNVFLERAFKAIQECQNTDGGWPLDTSAPNKETNISLSPFE